MIRGVEKGPPSQRDACRPLLVVAGPGLPSRPPCSGLAESAPPDLVNSSGQVWASLVTQLVQESTCSAGDPSSIPGLGRAPGEGIGYPLQYSLASLVAQMVKNLPAMWKTWVRFLGWEDPLEEGMAIHSSILAWTLPMDRGAWQGMVHGCKELDRNE